MSEQRILAFSGKKSAGKNTACNFVVGTHLSSLGIIHEGFMISQETEGQLYVTDIHGDKDAGDGILDLNNRSIEFLTLAEEYIFPFVKIYSFADLLKEEVCMKILGLTRDQCYGTDEEKNSLTALRWEDMPCVVTEVPDMEIPTVGFLDKNAELEFINGRIGEYYLKHKITGIVYHKPGLMTAREVMQFVGSEIFRKMYNNVWVDALIRRIQQENSLLALISDCRFPNEVQGVLDAGGQVIRLTKDVFAGKDTHQSETALDRDKFDWSRFSAVIDNHNMNINEQNVATFNTLNSLGWGWAEELKTR